MRRLAVFARWPVPGQVKTRLTPALPPELACDLHRALLGDTCETAARAGADEVSVFWTGAAPAGAAFPLPPGAVAAHQSGPDLGARLAAAFTRMLRDGASRAVVIGTDCPDLDDARLRAAFDALENAHVVVGPATDGGYYLVGLRRPAPALFAGIDWGTDRVLGQTLERAAAERLSTTLLGELADLDTPSDLVKLLARRAHAPAGRPGRLASALAAMGLLPPGA